MARRIPSVAVLAALLAATAAPRSALAHGGRITPPPAPPPTPDWMKGDPYAPPGPTRPPIRPPVPPITTPRNPGTPPTTPSPLAPGQPVQPGFTPRPGGHTPATPSSPAPPSSPPPPTPTTPTTPSPGATPPRSAAPSEPGSAPTTPPVQGRPSRDRASGRAAPGGGEDWTTWWEANADALRAETDVAPVETVSTGLDPRRAMARARDLEVVPFLRAVADGTHGDDDDLRASAWIALGKTTAEPEDVERLLAWLRDATAPSMTRESAAIALGCLRRTAPAEQLDGALLDRVRDALFDAIDDDGVPVRVRCFCAFSVGLLGDQPGRTDDAFGKDGRRTTQRLWTRLLDARAGAETTVALTVALSMQPPAGVPAAVRDALRTAATTGRLGGRDRGAVAQAHATIALARLARGECAGVLLALVKSRVQPAEVRRSALLALGSVAPDLAPALRADAGEQVLAFTRRGDPDTAGFAALSVGRLVAASYADPDDRCPRTAALRDALDDVAERGAAGVRPFAALALAIATRSRPGTAPRAERDDGRAVSLRTLRAVVDRESDDPDARAASTIALGLLDDDASADRFGRIVAADGDARLRAAACAALGLAGSATPAAQKALEAALAAGDDDVRREAARALGVLRATGAVTALVSAVERAAADHVRARLAVALGEIGDFRAVRPLVRVASDRAVADATRAVAVAALGLLADPESRSSLSRLGADLNYLARTDALNEVLSLL